MELPKSPVQTTINLLAELRNRPDGWGAIAAQNILLNKSGNDAEQAEAEMCAFSAAGEIIGDEDLQGEPFVGRGGKLLDQYLAVVDLERGKNIYIANMVKCRPPKNRDPKPEEQEMCIEWLRTQVRMIKPKIIVCLGRIAAARLIKSDIKITKEHGQWIEKNGVLMMAMLHPAAILRDPRRKPDAFDDFLKLRDKINEVCDHTYE